MKKILLFAASAVAMFAAGSCQKEISHLDGDTKVKFEVSAGDVLTKVIADASNITVLHWELYGPDIRTAQAPLGEGTITDNDGDKQFTVELRLVADQEYNIVFWAETDKGSTHYVTEDLRCVKINTYTDENANDESRAAFFGKHKFNTENGVSVTERVTLYRPFSQINLGSTTYETSLNLVNGGKVKVETSEMTVSAIANAFNTLDGVGEALNGFDGNVTFKAAATPNGVADETEKILEVNSEKYYWIGMNYLIVEGNADNVDVNVTLSTNMGVVKHAISNVPVKENYRTNILGDFLTTGAEFEIIIDERFEAEYNGNTEGKFPTGVPSWEYVDGVKTMSLSNDLFLYDGELFCDTANETEDLVIDGNGYRVTFIPDDAEDLADFTKFSSAAKNHVTVKDITFAGEFHFLSAGYWHGAPSSQKTKQFYTTFENVDIINAAVSPVVAAQALFCDGVTVLNNCNIYGTQKSQFVSYDVEVFDLTTFNYTHTTINGGKYGRIGAVANWPQATLIVNGAEVETIENWYIARTTSSSHPDGETRGLYIYGDSKIKTINTHGSTSQWTQLYIAEEAQVDVLTFDELALTNPKFTADWIKIADGTVGKVIANGVEMTLAEFKVAYNL